MNRAEQAALVAGLVSTAGCGVSLNYPASGGPRYAGEPAAFRSVARAAPDHLRLVTFNTHFARHIDRVTELLRSAPLADADVVALQEVDAKATREVATALGMSYVYYPGARHPTTGRDFGNAVLSRWPVVDDWKVTLPHRGRLRNTQREATAATILIGHDSVRVYSVHLSTMGEVGPGSRREQARAVIADAARFPRVVVLGDLNGVAVADEFVVRGFAWPTKGNGPTIGVFTWDHMFLRGIEAGDEVSTGVVELDNGASDHRPVWMVVALHQNRT